MDLKEALSRENGSILWIRKTFFLCLFPLSLCLLDVLENHGQIVHNILLALLLNPEYLSALIKDLARKSNVDSCLELVSGKHPEFYSSLLDSCDSLSRFVLELILDSSCSKEIEVSLDF